MVEVQQHQQRFQARQQRRQRSLMITTATIVRSGDPVSDGAGGVAAGASTTITVPCQVRRVNQTPQEQTIAAYLQGVEPYTIEVPVGTDVQNTDTIEVGSHRYEVRGVIEGHTFATATYAVCVEVS
jgi:hypothetical protein